LDFIPITTERLQLRTFRLEDGLSFYPLASDPDATRYMAWPRHKDLAETERVLGLFAQWRARDEDWPVALWTKKDPTQLLGFSGFQKPLSGAPWVSWLLGPDAWGKGYAQEAVRALLAWGWAAQPHWRCVQAPIHPDNGASLRLAQRLGFREVPSDLTFKMVNLDGQDHAATLWQLDRP
jgi:RimJ/RimL family protein N-acetyltransferase